MRRPIEPGTRLWDEAGLITFTLTTGAAFALQVMHPAVGTVVGEHSVFRTDAVGRARQHERPDDHDRREGRGPDPGLTRP